MPRYWIGNLQSSILTGISFPSSRAVEASPSTQSDLTEIRDHSTMMPIPPYGEAVSLKQLGQRFGLGYVLMCIAQEQLGHVERP